MNTSAFINIIYLFSAVLFILGIKKLSKVRTARQGNFLAALGMFLGVLATLCQQLEWELIVISILLGSCYRKLIWL